MEFFRPNQKSERRRLANQGKTERTRAPRNAPRTLLEEWLHGMRHAARTTRQSWIILRPGKHTISGSYCGISEFPNGNWFFCLIPSGVADYPRKPLGFLSFQWDCGSFEWTGGLSNPSPTDGQFRVNRPMGILRFRQDFWIPQWHFWVSKWKL